MAIKKIRKPRHRINRIFHDRPGDILTWLNGKGYNGPLSDAMMSYFKTKSGLASGTLFDHINATMDVLGYTGSIGDKLAAFFKAQTSEDYLPTAENGFWEDTSLDFSSGGGGGGDQVLLETGDGFLMEDGNTLIQE